MLEDLKVRVATIILDSLPSHTPFPSGTLGSLKSLRKKKIGPSQSILTVQQSRGDGSPGDLPTDTFCLVSINSWLTFCCLYRCVVRRHYRKRKLNQNMVTVKQQLCKWGSKAKSSWEISQQRDSGQSNLQVVAWRGISRCLHIPLCKLCRTLLQSLNTVLKKYVHCLAGKQKGFFSESSAFEDAWFAGVGTFWFVWSF